MKGLDPEARVGAIAAEHPAAARVFERFHIDYCCGGSRSLGQVCRDAGIRTEEVLSALEQASAEAATDETDWTAAPLSELIEHITSQHHSYLRGQIPNLQRLLSNLLQSHHPNYPSSLLLLSGVLRGLRNEMETHMAKEELRVFPAIRRLESGVDSGRTPVRNAISVMMREHEMAGEALNEMRELTKTYQAPPEGCNTYQAVLNGLEQLEADLHVHIHLENNILFRKALLL